MVQQEFFVNRVFVWEFGFSRGCGPAHLRQPARPCCPVKSRRHEHWLLHGRPLAPAPSHCLTTVQAHVMYRRAYRHGGVPYRRPELVSTNVSGPVHREGSSLHCPCSNGQQPRVNTPALLCRHLLQSPK